MNKPRIGVSACLLGEKVRYNGDHKRQDWLVDRLGAFVSWVPICPEVAMGLGVPRESVRLERDPEGGSPRMVGNQSKRDLTALAQRTARSLLAKLPELDGYVLKKDSPSCGLERVRVFGKNGIPIKSGTGLFAAALREKFPELPMVEEGRLCDPLQREHFVIQVFAYHRLRQVTPDAASIQAFHQAHKLLLMAHSPEVYRRLGRIVGNARKLRPRQVLEHYRAEFTVALSTPSTARKRVNALQHALGYFKDLLEPREKAQILSVLEEYRLGELPLAAPAALLENLIARFGVVYLQGQVFFEPYPRRLGLRLGV